MSCMCEFAGKMSFEFPLVIIIIVVRLIVIACRKEKASSGKDEAE